MYTSHKFEKVLAIAEASQTPAVKNATRHYCGLQPQIVRSVSLIEMVANTVTAAIWVLKRRPTPGSSSGEEVVATLTVPVAGAAIGRVIYKKGLNVKLNPGDELVMELTQAATAGSVTISVELDVAPENIANFAPEAVASA